MEAIGIIMPIVELHVKFIRPAHYDDLLTIKTNLKELPANHRIEFHQEIYNERQELLAAGKVVLYFIKAKTMEKTDMPKELREKLLEFF